MVVFGLFFGVFSVFGGVFGVLLGVVLVLGSYCFAAGLLGWGVVLCVGGLEGQGA